MTEGQNTPEPIGYILAMRSMVMTGTENAEYRYTADWDGEVHPTLEAAWDECKQANGEEWAADIEKYGPMEDNLRVADYLPYALTVAIPQ